MRKGIIGLPILVAALVAAGCSRGEAPAAAPPAGRVETAGVMLPSQLLGLVVQPEDVGEQFAETRQSYVESLGLFSMRENDLVRATLQVSRLNSLADPNDAGFRNSILNRLGTTRPRLVKVGESTVWATTGTDQLIFAWFEGRGFFVLTAHRDYEFPRALLRRVIETIEI